jgi:Secretion system C-terminal sorting domain
MKKYATILLLLCSAIVHGQTVTVFAEYYDPFSMVFGRDGMLYVGGQNEVDKFDSLGNKYRVAGSTVAGFSGDNGPASAASFNGIASIVFDRKGNLFVAEMNNYRVRRIDASSGLITTFAGIGDSTDTTLCNGCPATSNLIWPWSLTVDDDDDLYVFDLAHSRVRKIDTLGIITNYAGNGHIGVMAGNGGPATQAAVANDSYISWGHHGELFICEGGFGTIGCIRRVASDGIISTIAGDSSYIGYNGDHIPAVHAKIDPFGSFVDSRGFLFFGDNTTRLRYIDSTGLLHTLAGDGLEECKGDSSTSGDSAHFVYLVSIAQDRCGNFFVGDIACHKIYKINLNPDCYPQGVPQSPHGPATMAVYPNPAGEAVTVTAGGIPAHAELTDCLGRVLRSRSEFAGPSFTWPLEGLPAGMYLVRVTDGRGDTDIRKLIHR